MDYTLEQFKSEAKRYPVVVKVDGIHVPVDVALFVASVAISGVCVRSVQVYTQDYAATGTRILILAGVSWEPFVSPSHQTTDI